MIRVKSKVIKKGISREVQILIGGHVAAKVIGTVAKEGPEKIFNLQDVTMIDFRRPIKTDPFNERMALEKLGNAFLGLIKKEGITQLSYPSTGETGKHSTKFKFLISLTNKPVFSTGRVRKFGGILQINKSAFEGKTRKALWRTTQRVVGAVKGKLGGLAQKAKIRKPARRL